MVSHSEKRCSLVLKKFDNTTHRENLDIAREIKLFSQMQTFHLKCLLCSVLLSTNAYSVGGDSSIPYSSITKLGTSFFKVCNSLNAFSMFLISFCAL